MEIDKSESYVSPDGLLQLCIHTAPDGDIRLGFYGFQWHTHADILAATSGLKPDEATRKFLYDMVDGVSVIVLWSVDNEIRDVWVSDDPAADFSYVNPEYAGLSESVELRYWDGTLWNGKPTTLDG